MIALDRRRGSGENTTELIRRARGRFCLILNEDSELEPGATAALHAALASAEGAAAAGATLVRPDGAQQPSAYRFPSPWTALLSLVGLGRRFVVQSHGARIRDVDWAPAVGAAGAARGGRRHRVARRRRGATSSGACGHAGWRVLYVPEARAVHHERR